jgi:hypothetical protein
MQPLTLVGQYIGFPIIFHWCLYEVEYIFLAMVIPRPEHPEKNLSILLQPLVDELLQLWAGVDTWDASVKRKFTMRAA